MSSDDSYESPDVIDSDVEDELFEQKLREEGERELEQLEKKKNHLKSDHAGLQDASKNVLGTVAVASSVMPARVKSRETFSGALIRIPLLVSSAHKTVMWYCLNRLLMSESHVRSSLARNTVYPIRGCGHVHDGSTMGQCLGIADHVGGQGQAASTKNASGKVIQGVVV